MSNILGRDVDRIHSWLVNRGQGFRIESVGYASTQGHRLPGLDLTGSVHITIYENLAINRIEDTLQALYMRVAQIRELAYKEGLVQEDTALPYVSYYNRAMFATWYIHKYNIDFRRNEV